MLYEQAYYKGIEVTHLLSNKNIELDINFPRPGKIKFVDYHNIDVSKITEPIILAELNNISDLKNEIFSSISYNNIKDLNNYAMYKRFLFDKLIKYKEKYNKLTIIVLNVPYVWEIKNRTDQEKHLVAGDPKRNIETIMKSVFRIHGYSKEYIKEVTNRIQIINNHGINLLADKQGKYVNILNGYRVTTNVPEDFSRTIYMFGNSFCYGLGADDSYTLSSILQKELNKYYNGHSPYAVLNCANGGGMNYHEQWKSFEYHAPQNGDIAIFVIQGNTLCENTYKDKFIWYNATEILNRPHNFGEIFFDPYHLNAFGYEACGKYLAKHMFESKICKDNEALKQIQKQNINNLSDIKLNLNDAELKKLNIWISKLKKLNKNIYCDRIGSIVMNCNPFTNGHRFLIEEASKKCDILYVFVVEEDRSVFPFKDRFELVKRGVSDLNNVIVVPSGQFIISQITFQAYFQKEEKQEIVINASNDITIFATKIAPELGINIRFAGDEPFDNITNQYNSTMKRLLPRFGIKFEVIKRKQFLDIPISASRVRSLLLKKSFNEIKSIVPKTTYNYLFNRFAKSKKILVLGGTRFMGIRLVEALIKQNHFVTIATRGRNKDNFGKNVNRIIYDRLNLSSVKNMLYGKHYDIIIDTSAYSSNSVNNVLSNISCDKYIQVSSVAVYPEHKLDLKENMFDPYTSAFNFSDNEVNYGIGKRYAECVAMQLFPQYNPIIVRIPFVVEPNNLDNKELNLRLFFYVNHIINNIPMNVTNFDYNCSFVTTFEEADFLSYVAIHDYNGIFNFCSDGYVSVGDIINYIEQKSGCKAIYSNTGDIHPFRKEHFGTTGFSLNLDHAKSIGYKMSKLDSWIWKLLDTYIEICKNNKNYI